MNVKATYHRRMIPRFRRGRGVRPTFGHRPLRPHLAPDGLRDSLAEALHLFQIGPLHHDARQRQQAVANGLTRTTLQDVPGTISEVRAGASSGEVAALK